MSSSQGREISFGVVGGPMFIPKAGAIGPTLDLLTTGSKVIKMTLGDDNLVYIDVKGDAGSVRQAAVPTTYFTHMVFAKK